MGKCPVAALMWWSCKRASFSKTRAVNSPSGKNKCWELKHKQPAKAIVTALLKDGRANVTGLYSEKANETYDATVVLEDNGLYYKFHLEFSR